MTIATVTKTFVVPAALGIAIIAIAQVPGDGPNDSQRNGGAPRHVTLAAAAGSRGATGQPTGDDPAVPFVATAAGPTSNDTTQSAPAAGGTSGTTSNTAAALEGLGSAGEPRTLKLDFRHAPWEDVLEWFAKEAGLFLSKDVIPRGTFNYSDPDREFTLNETMDVINKHFLFRGYTLVQVGQTLHVLDFEDDETDERVLRDTLAITPLDKLDERGDYEMVKVRFDVGIAPQLVADEIEDKGLLSPHGSIVVIPQARQILVTDTGANLRLIHAILQQIERLAVEEQANHPVLPPLPSPMALADANPLLLPDVSRLDVASLQILEDYYSQRAEASEVRQQAKAVEMGAYDKGGTSRDRELDRSKRIAAQADIIDLRAEEDLYKARAKLLRDKREQAQTPIERDVPAAVLAPGDRLLVRLHVGAADPSQNLNEIARVEAGGTLPLGPILGRVQVAGKSLQEAEDEVRKAAAKYYRDASVQITHAADTPNPSR